jgi:hypothetical protein
MCCIFLALGLRPVGNQNAAISSFKGPFCSAKKRRSKQSPSPLRSAPAPRARRRRWRWRWRRLWYVRASRTRPVRDLGIPLLCADSLRARVRRRTERIGPPPCPLGSLGSRQRTTRDPIRRASRLRRRAAPAVQEVVPVVDGTGSGCYAAAGPLAPFVLTRRRSVLSPTTEARRSGPSSRPSRFVTSVVAVDDDKMLAAVLLLLLLLAVVRMNGCSNKPRRAGEGRGVGRSSSLCASLDDDAPPVSPPLLWGHISAMLGRGAKFRMYRIVGWFVASGTTRSITASRSSSSSTLQHVLVLVRSPRRILSARTVPNRTEPNPGQRDLAWGRSGAARDCCCVRRPCCTGLAVLGGSPLSKRRLARRLRLHSLTQNSLNEMPCVILVE